MKTEFRGKDEAGIVTKGGITLFFSSAKEAAAAKKFLGTNFCMLAPRPAASIEDVLRLIADRYHYRRVNRHGTIFFVGPDFQVMIELSKNDPRILRVVVANFRGDM
jgi:hypothetical protein